MARVLYVPPVQRVTKRRARIVTGDVTLPDTSGAWQSLSGFELQLPATVGDDVEIGFNFLRSASATAFLDVAVKVGSSIVRYPTTGGGTPALEGNPAAYITSTNFVGHAGPLGFTVTADDLDSGNVRFIIAVKAQGSGTLYASTNYPFNWQARNDGVVN